MSAKKPKPSPNADEVLRRMLSTPPTQHAPQPKRAKKKPAK